MTVAPDNSFFPIVIKVWAGREKHDMRYIRRSLPSLLASGLPDEARVILVNDRSPNPLIVPFLEELAAKHACVELWTNPERLGPNKGQEYNFAKVVEQFADAPYFVTCDDDIIYHPGWLQRQIQVYHEATTADLRGIFTALNVPFRPSQRTVQLPTCEVLVKERQAALNWFIPRDVYEEVGPFVDAGIAYDSEYCNRMAAKNIPVICMKPSYVQNIGYHGAYQSDETYTAPDYVGQTDLYLRSRDVWYATKRRVWDVARAIKHKLVSS